MNDRALTFVVIIVAVLIAAVQAQTAYARIYSNVEYNEEGGDLLGIELDISNSGNQIQGNLRIYEGGCASPIAVTGTLTDTKLEVSGTSDLYGKVGLEGRLDGDAIKGILRTGTQRSEKVSLKRIQKAHCQNSSRNP